MCAYSLDHITPSRLGIIRRESYDNVKCYQGLWGPALASTTRLDLRPENARYVPIVKERGQAATPGRFKSWVCADHSDVRVGRVVGLGGLEPPASPLSGARSNHLSYRPDAFREQSALLEQSAQGCAGFCERIRIVTRALARDSHECQVVELVGIEPTTPCLQSRCSPS